MGYDKYGLDWSVRGNKKPKKDTPEHPLLQGIGRGWSKKSTAVPVEEVELPAPAATTQPEKKNIRITNAKFIPDADY